MAQSSQELNIRQELNILVVFVLAAFSFAQPLFAFPNGTKSVRRIERFHGSERIVPLLSPQNNLYRITTY
jgi:hypothetical protein